MIYTDASFVLTNPSSSLMMIAAVDDVSGLYAREMVLIPNKLGLAYKQFPVPKSKFLPFPMDLIGIAEWQGFLLGIDLGIYLLPSNRIIHIASDNGHVWRQENSIIKNRLVHPHRVSGKHNPAHYFAVKDFHSYSEVMKMKAMLQVCANLWGTRSPSKKFCQKYNSKFLTLLRGANAGEPPDNTQRKITLDKMPDIISYVFE